MNEAIRIAIEKGGYKHEMLEAIVFPTSEAYLEELFNGHQDAYIVLDPLFWQALGKVTGWDSQTTESENFKFNGSNIIPNWLHIALYYNYLRLTGGDTEKFWQDLLNPNRE